MDLRLGFAEGLSAGLKPQLLARLSHGDLMPTALSSLLMGKDMRIYAQNSQGRLYKVGYIADIDLCGLIVFGAAFWKPQRAPGAPERV